MQPRDLFERLDRGLLESWVAESHQEDLHLDFKVLSGGDELDRDDRKNLAISTSAFANSEGGLVVWGVEAKRDAKGVDAATALRPIQNPRAVLSKLQSLTGTATSPTVAGILHRVIEGDSRGGFLATLVPASDAGPHMAKLGEDRYFKRSGDSFYKMEHFDIADMFGRRARPRLNLDVALRVTTWQPGPPGNPAVIAATVAIHNVGRALARYPFLSLGIAAPLAIAQYGSLISHGSGVVDILRLGAGRSWRNFAGGASDVIHAGRRLAMVDLEWTLPRSAWQSPLPEVSFDYEIACEGHELITGTKTLSGSELHL